MGNCIQSLSWNKSIASSSSTLIDEYKQYTIAYDGTQFYTDFPFTGTFYLPDCPITANAQKSYDYDPVERTMVQRDFVSVDDESTTTITDSSSVSNDSKGMWYRIITYTGGYYKREKSCYISNGSKLTGAVYVYGLLRTLEYAATDWRKDSYGNYLEALAWDDFLGYLNGNGDLVSENINYWGDDTGYNVSIINWVHRIDRRILTFYDWIEKKWRFLDRVILVNTTRCEKNPSYSTMERDIYGTLTVNFVVHPDNEYPWACR